MKYLNKSNSIKFILLLILNSNYSLAQNSYTSPYSVNFTYSKDSLIGDILNSERGNLKNCSNVPYDEWYSAKTKKVYGSWGPKAKVYSYPEFVSGKSLDWLRERVVAAAQMFIGYGYQHHHIPTWNPPADFPWSHCCMGENGEGFDCSDFTSFAYNIAFGLRLNTNTVKQSEGLELNKNNNSNFQTAEKIERPASYTDIAKTFEPGDLLFINKMSGGISHVIIWLGYLGKSDDNTPLILDSHGGEIKDSNGNIVPCGVYIRPFEENSWYFTHLSHALRIIK